jgi:uncharacterized protein (DUF305 family)
MKKIVILAAVGLTLASVAAYAQMHSGARHNAPMQQGEMNQAHGSGQMGHGHGMMMQGRMHGGASSHDGAQHSGALPKGDASPSSLAFHAINRKMHDGMNIAFTGAADADFVKGMIPHHQGAIDMAKTVLAFGKDPEVRKLAEEIIRAQESEIAFMQTWLKKRAQ